MLNAERQQAERNPVVQQVHKGILSRLRSAKYIEVVGQMIVKQPSLL